MRVLVVAFDVFSGVGGMQRYTRRFVRCLAELRGDVRRVRVVALWDRPDEVPDVPSHVDVTACGAGKMRMLAAFARALVRDRPDVIVYGHVRLTPLVFLARMLAPRARSILLTHGIEVWSPLPRPMRAAVERIDRVASVSAFTAQRSAAMLGRSPASVALVAPAVDARDPSPRDGRDPARILTVSRLAAHDREKGVERLVRAMPLVRACVPGARLDVVGDGVLRRELEELAAAVAPGCVTFHGRVSDAELDDLYARASVFALPSAKEGFGIVYLEAWQHRLPVVAGSRDAGAEVVADGVTGRVVDPHDGDTLAATLVSLLQDPARARAMGAAGAEFVRTRYTHERFRDDVRDLVRMHARAEATS